MASLSEIVDGKGKVNYRSLLSYVKVRSAENFKKEAKHPLLVGKELYQGELQQRKNVASTSDTNTLIFNAAAFRQETVRDAGGFAPKGERSMPNKAPSPSGGNAGISHAIYVLRKNRESIEKTPNIISIGRAMDNDLVIPDYVVSKYHAQIIIFYGKYFIVDANSTNGTSVNKSKITPGVKAQLPLNSEIAFGRLCFVFVSAETLHKYLS